MNEVVNSDPLIGRITRLGYWKVMLPLLVAQVCIGFFANEVVKLEHLQVIVIIIFIAPAIIVQIGRWHDLGYSGWLILLNIIPIANIVTFIILGLAPGKDEKNKYGESPYSVETPDAKET